MGDTINMTDVSSKTLHEKTADCLNRVASGERLRVIRNGRTEAWLVPATDAQDPEWNDILSEVREARKAGKPPQANPVIAARKRRNYASNLR
jgi:antitoxin (DNA-binding transcriptional repressor) of toxin-antitoxin stability system